MKRTIVIALIVVVIAMVAWQCQDVRVFMKLFALRITHGCAIELFEDLSFRITLFGRMFLKGCLPFGLCS